MKVQEAYQTPNKLDQRKKTPQHKIIKTPNIQNKERILRAAKENEQVTYEGTRIKNTPDFSQRCRQQIIHFTRNQGSNRTNIFTIPLPKPNLKQKCINNLWLLLSFNINGLISPIKDTGKQN